MLLKDCSSLNVVYIDIHFTVSRSARRVFAPNVDIFNEYYIFVAHISHS
jgi:hypothetical protein